MRVYALYAKNKKLLAFLIFLTAMIVINETLLMTGTSCKSRRIFNLSCI